MQSAPRSRSPHPQASPPPGAARCAWRPRWSGWRPGGMPPGCRRPRRTSAREAARGRVTPRRVRCGCAYVLLCRCRMATPYTCATGAGSARPVVSMMMWSNFTGRSINFLSTRIWTANNGGAACVSQQQPAGAHHGRQHAARALRTRSPRTVQQMQPLFISTTLSAVCTESSASSMPICRAAQSVRRRYTCGRSGAQTAGSPQPPMRADCAPRQTRSRSRRS
jgi:hypothetical protein